MAPCALSGPAARRSSLPSISRAFASAGRQRAQQACWIAGIDARRRDVLRDDRARTDHSIVADRDRQDRRVTSDRDAIADPRALPARGRTRWVAVLEQVVDEHDAVRDETALP